MKHLLVFLTFLTFSVSFSQNYSESFNASNTGVFEDFNDFTESVVNLTDFEFSFDQVTGYVTFNAPNKIDNINLFDENQQIILSANKDMITEGKMSLINFPEGTYYLELVIGDSKGSQMLTIK